MKALIVDDSKFLREYLQQQLTAMGLVCSEAENGLGGLEALAREQFSLMLLDVNMPVMHGLECLRRVRGERMASGMKVMMVTTEADNSFIQEALENGADEFLMKPFSPQSLREKLLLMGLELPVAG